MPVVYMSLPSLYVKKSTVHTDHISWVSAEKNKCGLISTPVVTVTLSFEWKFPLNVKGLLHSKDLLNYFKVVTQLSDRIFFCHMSEQWPSQVLC